MTPEKLQRWVMEKHPNREPTNDLLAYPTCALVIAPGGGSLESSRKRIRDTRGMVRLFQIGHVWISHTDSDRDPHQPSLEEARRIFSYPDTDWTPEDLRVQESVPGANTATQARWFAELLAEHPEVLHVIYSAAKYHTARFALTAVKAWDDRRDQRPVRFSVAPTEDPKPTVGTEVNQTLEGELGRIAQYQKTGDVATYEIAKRYF